MRMPMKARYKSLLTVMTAGVFLAGCAGEATAPTAVKSATLSQSRTSPFVPNAADKALVGVADGTYEFDVDPSVDQSVNLGPNYLSIPANAICDIANSSYGMSHWNESCVPQSESVHITAVVRNATTDHPSIDFFPAMRFSPDKNVNLYIYVPTGMDDFQKNWTMKYCPEGGSCVDESLADPDLRSFADRDNMMVFRRIKHFSGYIVVFDAEQVVDPLM